MASRKFHIIFSDYNCCCCIISMETKKDGRIQFRIEDDVPAGEQMEGFEKWLEDNKPSQAQVSGFVMSERHKF